MTAATGELLPIAQQLQLVAIAQVDDGLFRAPGQSLDMEQAGPAVAAAGAQGEVFRIQVQGVAKQPHDGDGHLQVVRVAVSGDHSLDPDADPEAIVRIGGIIGEIQEGQAFGLPTREPGHGAPGGLDRGHLAQGLIGEPGQWITGDSGVGDNGDCQGHQQIGL